MIGLDTTVLTLLLNEKSDAPPDPATGKPVTRCKERVEFLVTTLHKQRQSIVIPTTVLSEVLVRTGNGLKYVEMLEKWTVFDIRDFNKLAAIELAIMQQQIAKAGHKKGAQREESWQKVKFDRQIVAICKVAQVKTLYASDPSLANFARSQGIEVFGVHELPLPPEDPQMSMNAVLDATLGRRGADEPKPEDVDNGEDDTEEIEKPD